MAQPIPLKGSLEALCACCDVITPTDAAYDGARIAWNRDIVGKPSLIAQPSNTEQVAKVVQWAVQCGAVVCVASGRHSIYASKNDSLMVDLSKFQQLEVDPVARTVVVGPGIRLGQFDAATAKHGLATTAGTNPGASARSRRVPRAAQ